MSKINIFSYFCCICVFLDHLCNTRKNIEQKNGGINPTKLAGQVVLERARLALDLADNINEYHRAMKPDITARLCDIAHRAKKEKEP